MAPAVRGGPLEHRRQAHAVEDVVAQDQAARPPGEELAADQKGLGQSFRPRLFGIREPQAPLAAIAQEPAEKRQVVGSGDDQYLANAREHERGQRIVDHRLVVDRQQLLANDLRHGVQSRAAAARQDNAFHAFILRANSRRLCFSITAGYSLC